MIDLVSATSAGCVATAQRTNLRQTRGAYTVRALASLLHMYGLIRAGNEPFSNIVTHCRTLHEAGVLTQKHTRLFQGSAQELQAEINDKLLETIHKGELADWAEFGKVRAAYEKALRGPEDLFLEAEERKRELKRKRKK